MTLVYKNQDGLLIRGGKIQPRASPDSNTETLTGTAPNSRSPWQRLQHNKITNKSLEIKQGRKNKGTFFKKIKQVLKSYEYAETVCQFKSERGKVYVCIFLARNSVNHYTPLEFKLYNKSFSCKRYAKQNKSNVTVI